MLHLHAHTPKQTRKAIKFAGSFVFFFSIDSFLFSFSFFEKSDYCFWHKHTKSTEKNVHKFCQLNGNRKSIGIDEKSLCISGWYVLLVLRHTQIAHSQTKLTFAIKHRFGVMYMWQSMVHPLKVAISCNTQKQIPWIWRIPHKESSQFDSSLLNVLLIRP